MTIQGLTSSYYTSSLYGSANQSNAAAGLEQLLEGAGGQGGNGMQISQMPPPPPPPSSSDGNSAMAQLKSVDPTLAKKMEAFNKQMDKLAASGASAETMAETMKTNMDSLSDTEKSELQSVFGSQESAGASSTNSTDGPGAPPDLQSDLVAQLKTTDSALATKLQGYFDDVKKLKQSGASDSDIQSEVKSDISALSDTEKSEIDTALKSLFEKHQQQTQSGANSALLQSQLASTYLQAQMGQYSSQFASAA